MTTKICVVTGSRAEFGILYHTIKQIEQDRQFKLQLIVTGMHLSKEFGYTIEEIIDCGFRPTETIEMVLSSDTNVGMCKSVGLGIINFADCFSRLAPDIVLVVGDRYEIFAASTAAMALNIPIAHISGGEITEGAIDEQMRHAITKMSHMHFVTLEENAQIVMQMGEEPWRVHTVGAPWIDNIRYLEEIDLSTLSKRIRIDLTRPTILFTFHPVTLQLDETKKQINNILMALEDIQLQIIFTYPNADAGGMIIIEAIKEFVATHSNAVAFKSLGSKIYLNLLRHIKLMVGNSSSGMVESQSFKVPVINIGIRQKGRKVTENIINCPPETEAVFNAIKTGLSSEFSSKIKEMENPYHKKGMGTSYHKGFAENIVSVLTNMPNKHVLLNKKFLKT